MKILLIEDDATMARFLQHTLLPHLDRHASIDHVSSMAEATAKIKEALPGRWDVILLDLELPDSSSLDSLRTVMELRSGIPIVVVSGTEDQAIIDGATFLGAQDYLVKGQFEPKELAHKLQFAFYKHANAQLVAEMRKMSEEFDRAAEEMKRIRAQYLHLTEVMGDVHAAVDATRV